MTGRRGFLAMLAGLMPGARLMRALPVAAPVVAPSPLALHAAAQHFAAAALFACAAGHLKAREAK